MAQAQGAPFGASKPAAAGGEGAGGPRPRRARFSARRMRKLRRLDQPLVPRRPTPFLRVRGPQEVRDTYPPDDPPWQGVVADA